MARKNDSDRIIQLEKAVEKLADAVDALATKRDTSAVADAQEARLLAQDH